MLFNKLALALLSIVVVASALSIASESSVNVARDTEAAVKPGSDPLTDPLDKSIPQRRQSCSNE